MDTLGVILLKKGQGREALALFRKAIDRTPDDPGVRFHLAQAMARTGDVAEARRQLSDLLSKNQPFAERKAAESLLLELELR